MHLLLTIYFPNHCFKCFKCSFWLLNFNVSKDEAGKTCTYSKISLTETIKPTFASLQKWSLYKEENWSYCINRTLWKSRTLHCIKYARIRVFTDPCSPVFSHILCSFTKNWDTYIFRFYIPGEPIIPPLTPQNQISSTFLLSWRLNLHWEPPMICLFWLKWRTVQQNLTSFCFCWVLPPSGLKSSKKFIFVPHSPIIWQF